ncbi:MAG TPA: LysE family translocator [Bauldia sp.]|nr:LysE family translocator [Bauldia sp.]
MLADFVPSFPVLAAFAVASVVLALTPGPDMTLFLSKTIGQSREAGIAAFAGVSTGLVVHSILVAAGLSVLLAASVTAFTVLKIAGAAYLAWLALEAIRHGSSLSLDRKAGRETPPALWLKGLLVNLLNPKVIVFFVTFLPQFVSPADPHAAGKLLFLGLTFMVISIPVCLGLIWSAGAIARLLRRSPRATRVVDWLFAGVLAAFAVRLVLAEARPG